MPLAFLVNTKAVKGGFHPYEAARHKLGNVADRVCRRLGLAVAFHSSVGVKFLNSLLSSAPLDYPAYGTDDIRVEATELTHGTDFLKDPWTLCGTSLRDSPYLGLMEALLSGLPADETEYVARVRAGTLDWQRPAYVSAGYLAYLERSFHQALQRIKAGERPLVRVALLDDRAYLLDGKHRAALALALGAEVRCQDLTVLFYDSYYAWLEGKMLERPHEYSKQLRLFASARRTLRPETAGQP